MDKEQPTTSYQISNKRRPSREQQLLLSKLKLKSHITGPDCKCLVLRCFETVNENDRRTIISEINRLGSREEQARYLCDLITCKTVGRRRSKKSEGEPGLHTVYYSYKARVIRNGQVRKVKVCFKAFMSIHGLTQGRLKTLQKALAETGCPPVYNKGKDPSMKRNRLQAEAINFVKAHIQSFEEKSIYCDNKMYLPVNLTTKKMYDMYSEKFPDHKISYDKYRDIFKTKFNIEFGFPQKVPCSVCFGLKVQIDRLDKRLKTKLTHEDLQRREDLEDDRELHLLEVAVFDQLKKTENDEAQNCKTKEAILIGFKNDIKDPNATKDSPEEQSSHYKFRINVLSNNHVIFYNYSEIYGQEGIDDVCSMLLDFIFNRLDNKVEELTIFCNTDQSRNFTVFRMLHYIVHYIKKLKKIRVLYAVPGHTYREFETGPIEIHVELPDEWNDIIGNAGIDLELFGMVFTGDEIPFRSIGSFLSDVYTANCPFPITAVRELTVDKSQIQMTYCEVCDGEEFSYDVIKPKSTD